MALEPSKLHLSPNDQVPSLEIGPNLHSDTYFSKNPNDANVPTKR
jgi:hypothetical protein